MQAVFLLSSPCFHIFKFKEPPCPVASRKKKKKIRGGGGCSEESGWGDTVRLRIALWEGKGMGETLGTCRDLLALLWLQRS